MHVLGLKVAAQARCAAAVVLFVGVLVVLVIH
jgi:hypothetical protein